MVKAGAAARPAARQAARVGLYDPKIERWEQVGWEPDSRLLRRKIPMMSSSDPAQLNSGGAGTSKLTNFDRSLDSLAVQKGTHPSTDRSQ